MLVSQQKEGGEQKYYSPPLVMLRLGAIEEGGHGTILKDFVDGLCQKRCNGQHREVGPALGGLREGIGGDNFLRAALGEALAGWVGENAVGAGDDDLLRTGVLQNAYGAGDGATGVNHVVEKHAVLAVNIAYHAVGHLSLIHI